MSAAYKHGRVEVERDPDDNNQIAVTIDGRYDQGFPIWFARDLYAAMTAMNDSEGFEEHA